MWCLATKQHRVWRRSYMNTQRRNWHFTSISLSLTDTPAECKYTVFHTELERYAMTDLVQKLSCFFFKNVNKGECGFEPFSADHQGCLFAKSSRSHVPPHIWRWQCAGIGLALFIRESDQPCYIKQRATHWTTKQKCLQMFVMDYVEIRPDHCSNFLLLWLFCVCLLYSQIMLFII